MPSNRPLRFPTLSVSQTQRLLASVAKLPLSAATARRIRATVIKEVAPRSLVRNRIRKTLLPIAACLLAVVMFFVAFPKAALAVSEFIERIFTPSQYMNQAPSERTPVPSIDGAITAAAPQDGDYTIVLLSDLPNAQGYIDDRAKSGFAPFQTADWEWIYDIRPEIAEVLYDGNQLIWNTNLYTTNEHVREFMECFGVESGSKQRIDALMGNVTYTVAGSSAVYPLNVSGHGITPIFDETALASANHVVLYSDFMLDEEKPLPDGVITITQTINLYEVDSQGCDTLIALIHHTFTFDTTKGNTPSAQGEETDLPLSGEAYLSFMNRGNNDAESARDWSIETKKVSFDEIKLHIAFEYLPTGIMVHITVPEMPDSWTEEMLKGFLTITNRNIDGEYTTPGIAADLYVDGVFVSEAPLPDSWAPNEATYLLPVFPNQYESTKSVMLKLSLLHYVTLNGTDQQEGEIIEFSENSSVNLDGVVEGIPLIEIPVLLPRN